MAISAIFFNACKKENLLVEAQPTKLNIKEDPKLFEDAKEYFTKNFGKTHSISPQTNIAAGSSQTIEPISITPEWTQAVVAPYLQKYPILVVPVEDIKQLNVGTTTYKLVFFRDSLGEIQAKLNIAVPDSSYGVTHTKSNVNDFTGCFFQMDMQGKLDNLLRVKEGKFTQKGQIVFQRNTIRLSTRDGECDAPDPTDCPTWGRRSVLQVILDGLGSFAEWVANGAVTVWNGGDASNSSATGGSFNFGGGTYYDNTDGTGSSGSTSAGSTGTYPNSNYLIDEIGNEIFDLTEERATLLYINVRLTMTHQETQFLRTNRLAALQIESYLRNNTAFLGAENARAHLSLLINDAAYRSANQQVVYASTVIETLGRYKKAGFTDEEFARLYDDKALFQEVEAYLNENTWDLNSKEYITFISNLLKQSKEFQNASSGFCSKSDLYNFVKNSPTLCPNCSEGQLQNKIGELFEDAYNRWQAEFMINVGDYQPNLDSDPNKFIAYSPLRGANVVPDGFMKSIKSPSGIQLGVDQKAHWIECKASNKDIINLSDYEGQIGGEIDALSRFQPWACSQNIAAITYATTIDMVPSPKLVKTANSKGIWILNSYSYFKIENGKMYLTFTPAYPMIPQFGTTSTPTIKAIYQALSNNYVELK